MFWVGFCCGLLVAVGVAVLWMLDLLYDPTRGMTE